ncbi:MAG: SDR family NAD(P)-dependent oxidoreductase [Alphaproteobacteria bacterium]|nr:SDR family NAD(P)-dependent oxidoreductase [Alphaproteobacteria bacterium]MCB9696226.1 SDR family NAD(P)-dependent oxidoreductase [Alphaproteobacteria bacterium]
MSTNRVALVTGASAGIGKDIVRRLLKDGWTVYGAARRVDAMQDIASEGARVLPLDVTDEASTKAAVETLLAAEGRIDALVNNAGYGSYGALEEVPLDEARRQFEVNVFGVIRLSQLVLPTMRQQRSGTIVNITSMGGRIWMPIGGWYHATKHALEVLSDTMRVEVAPFGVKVVVVQPGAIQSEWSGVAADNLEKASQGTLYAQFVAPMTKVLRGYTTASPASVVSDAVSRALATTAPRRRYATPFDAKGLIFLHRWMPDWLWERFIVRALA